MNERRARFRRLGFVFTIALLIRLVYWTEIRGTALDRWHEWDQSDMHTYLEQARRIAGGDWLGRDPFHPYHLWQHDAPAEKWIDWYPAHSFHQAPAYSYLLAISRFLGSHNLAAIKLFQLLLGAFLAVLLHEIGHDLAGPLAGWIAGLIAAVYGPLIQIELQILRDGPAVFATALALGLLMLHWRKANGIGLDRGGRWRLGCIGALLGALTMLHETGQVAMAAAGAAVAYNHGFGILKLNARRLEGLVALGCLVAGFAVGFSPLMARNLIVAAPPLSISSRSGIVFVMSNYALAKDGGARWGIGSPELIKVMENAESSPLGVLGAVAKSYSGNAARIPLNLWAKFRRVCAVPEAPDNTSYAFYQTRSHVLLVAPAWWLIFAPGLAGLAMLLTRARNRSKIQMAEPLAGVIRADAAMIALFFLAYLGALSLTHAIGRLRLCIVPTLIPLTGAFVGLEIDAALRRAWKGAGIGFAVLLGAIVLQFAAQGDLGARKYRAADYFVAAGFELEADDLKQGAEDLKRSVELGIESPAVYRMLGEVLKALGRNDEAKEWLDKASALE